MRARHATSRRSRQINPGAFSAHAIAAAVGANHQYILSVRKATATFVQDFQLDAFRAWVSAPGIDWFVLQLAVDETESVMVVDKSDGTYSLVMSHMRVLRRFQHGHSDKVDVILPTTAVKDTTAESFDVAVAALIGGFLVALQRAAVPVVTILNSDKAKSIVKLGRAWSADAKTDETGKKLVFHGHCMMHMMWASLIGSIAHYSIASDLYCASILLHRAYNVQAIKTCLKAYIRQHLRRVFDPPSDAHRVRNEQIVELMEVADGVSSNSKPEALIQHGRRGGVLGQGAELVSLWQNTGDAVLCFSVPRHYSATDLVT